MRVELQQRRRGGGKVSWRAPQDGDQLTVALRAAGSRTVPPQLPFSVIANFRTTGYERCVRHAGAGPGFGMVRTLAPGLHEAQS